MWVKRIATGWLITTCVLALGARLPAADVETVSGRVYLDANGNGKPDSGEKGLFGIRITDSVNFVVTGEDGTYTIAPAEDTEIPVKGSRVVSVSWPSGKWPGGKWWRRLDDIQPGEKVDFGLRDDEQKLPFLFAHVGDQHGGRGPHGGFGALVKEQLGAMARFCVDTGDMGYAGPENAEEMFSGIAEGSKGFPVPVFFTPGNHDTVGRPPDRGKGPLFGVGGFTKYLGPVRWSFTYGGVHFVGVDWSNTKIGKTDEACELAADWLERDLKDLPAGTRIILFMHYPSGCGRFEAVATTYKVAHVFGGHNHTHREYMMGGVPATTTVNLMSKGALLGIVQDNEFNVVTYCGGCKGNPSYHSKSCGLKHFTTSMVAPIEQRSSLLPVLESRHGQHAGVVDQKLASGTHRLEAGQGPVDIAAEINPGAAGTAGLRIGDKEFIDIAYANKILSVAGTPIPFVLRAHEKALSWRIYIEKDRLTFYANHMIRLVKPVKVDNPSRVAAFAEGGEAVFKAVDVWSLGAPAKPAAKKAE